MLWWEHCQTEDYPSHPQKPTLSRSGGNLFFTCSSLAPPVAPPFSVLWQVDPVKLRQSIRTVIFNQSVVSFPMLVIFYPFLKWTGDPCCQELPTFHWILVELVLFTLVQEILIYYSHR